MRQDGKSVRRGLTSAVAGFLAFGAWATIANWRHGGHARLLAGLTQGTLSFCTTFVVATIAEFIHSVTRRFTLQLMLSLLGVPCVLIVALSAVHTAVGTPEVARTITPSVISGSLFSTLYVVALLRAAKDGEV